MQRAPRRRLHDPAGHARREDVRRVAVLFLVRRRQGRRQRRDGRKRRPARHRPAVLELGAALEVRRGVPFWRVLRPMHRRAALRHIERQRMGARHATCAPFARHEGRRPRRRILYRRPRTSHCSFLCSRPCTVTWREYGTKLRYEEYKACIGMPIGGPSSLAYSWGSLAACGVEAIVWGG